MSFNWSSLNAPISTFKTKRPRHGIQSDTLSAQRTRIMRQSVAQGRCCSACGHQVSLLYPALLNEADALVCIDCRDQR